ncbi:MAG: MgtC/SapB family protein [Lysobacteraceae bacterium]
MDMNLLDLLLRMSLGLGLGALIGLERQWRQRMAGLRTNALVALGAAAFTAFSMLQPGEVSPTRVAAQVVSGIGFLGAGVIMREGVNVRGLNTAATLWCAAAVGVLAGAGYPGVAVLTALLVLAANVVLRPMAKAFGPGSGSAAAATEHAVGYRLELEIGAEVELHLRALVLQSVSGGDLALRRIASTESATGRVRLQAELHGLQPADAVLEQAVRRFGLEPGVHDIQWSRVGEADPG